jgi:hypothetical protein
MKQEIVERHDKDENGNPAGGTTEGVGIFIEWQNGPLGRGADRREPNGAFVEGVIALTHLETALLWLQKRTADREEREVEGTHAR